MSRTEQFTLEGEPLLNYRIRKSQEIIQSVVARSDKMPLILQFSGGKDSLTMLHLVRSVTDNFVCSYMISGIDFAENVPFVQKICDKQDVELLLSHPSDYSTKKFPQNGFFQRLSHYRYFPTVAVPWCSVYLKIRPQRMMLRRVFGRAKLFKLNAVRRFESTRRIKLYKNVKYERRDADHREATQVFPIRDWRNEDVIKYLELNKIEIPSNPLYSKFGVSGCYYCPFYSPEIYQRILMERLCIFDPFIEWERKLNRPSVLGGVWLGKIKEEMFS